MKLQAADSVLFSLPDLALSGRTGVDVVEGFRVSGPHSELSSAIHVSLNLSPISTCPLSLGSTHGNSFSATPRRGQLKRTTKSEVES